MTSTQMSADRDAEHTLSFSRSEDGWRWYYGDIVSGPYDHVADAIADASIELREALS